MANNRDLVIKKDCCEVFQLSKYDFFILGEFARKGETNRNRINFAAITNRQISRIVDTLYENEFLRVVKSEAYRNIKGKTTKTFGLTLKGLLASLKMTNISENYIIKDYLGQMNNEKLAEIELNYIKNFLVYFFAYNRIRGMILDKMKNIGAWFYDFETKTSISTKEKEELDQKKKLMDMSFNNVEKKLKESFQGVELEKQWITMNRWHKAVEMFIVEPSFTRVVDSMKETRQEVLTRKKDLHSIEINDKVNDEGNDLYQKGCRITTVIETFERR